MVSRSFEHTEKNTKLKKSNNVKVNDPTKIQQNTPGYRAVSLCQTVCALLMNFALMK